MQCQPLVTLNTITIEQDLPEARLRLGHTTPSTLQEEPGEPPRILQSKTQQGVSVYPRMPLPQKLYSAVS
ncbi:hypothetical protein GCM10009425_15990 [Pseudomonas asuensis]|uniref:Integrase n=1 Tax=Pseudomonas asuensis TaxID=1825787 RepID=A0ABQ2GNN0_9PSED|nr:hypothetical protein GCM10009425_15990 [Pseudomonas asuensis]